MDKTSAENSRDIVVSFPARYALATHFIPDLTAMQCPEHPRISPCSIGAIAMLTQELVDAATCRFAFHPHERA